MSSGLLTVSTTDVTQAGTHQITVQVGIIGKLYALAEATFDVTITDDCSSTVISFKNLLTNMSWEMGSIAGTQNAEGSDTVSTAKGIPGSCGAYTYKIVGT